MGFIELATSPLPVVLAIFGGIAVLLAMIGSVEGNLASRLLQAGSEFCSS